MDRIFRDQDNGYSSLEDDNAPDAAGHPVEQTPAIVIDAALSRLRARAGCQDSFVRQLSTSLLSRMARNIFLRWESTRSASEAERVPDFLELVAEELFRFAQRSEIADEYERRNTQGTLEHDELEEQRRRERGDYRRSPRRRLSHSRSTDDPTLDLDILQPVRFRSSPDDSPMSPMRSLTNLEELRSFQRTENVRVHRRRHSKHVAEDIEKEERRRLRRLRRSVDSMESNKSVDSLEASMSPKKTEPVGELEGSGEAIKCDLQQKEMNPSITNAELVGELQTPVEAKVVEDLEEKSLESSISQEAADIAGALQSSVEHASSEYLEMKSLTSSISSMISDSASDIQGSGASIASEVDKDGLTQNPELPSRGAESNITPEESSTPSDELLNSIEEDPPRDVALETGARAKLSRKDKGRRKKRTRQVIESMSNRQITSLRSLDITTTDVLEMLIQLSVSLDRLDRLINGSRSRGSDNDVDETTLAQFFEGLEYARSREMANRAAVEMPDDPQLDSPELIESPRRDPKDNA